MPSSHKCYGEGLRASILVAASCVLAVFAWQALDVHYNYGGNWTGLYSIGGRFAQAPGLTEPLWLFPDSYGYDGQFYHLIAHDPWQERGFDRFVDNPRMRFRRILLPGLAHLVAGGRDRYVDAAYLGLMLLSIFLGTFWAARYAGLHGLTPWLGAVFLLTPAVLVSIDRLTVDAALACLCAGFVLFLETNPGWPLYLVLLAAPLARETGFVLPAAYVAALVWKRQFRRAGVFATAALPAAAWFVRISATTQPDQTTWLRAWPLAGFAERILDRYPYHFTWAANLAATVLDYAALAGIGLAMVWALMLVRARLAEPGSIAILAFGAMVVFVGPSEVWSEAYAFGRVFSPLLVLLALAAIPQRQWAMALPLLLVAPRVMLQMVPQALRVVKGMMG